MCSIPSRIHDGSPTSQEPSLTANHVPPEILELILTNCRPDEEFVNPSRATVPLSLCHVNRQWQNIAVSIPALWCSLSVDIRKMIALGDFLPKVWLQRARDLPLSLKLIWCPVIDTANSQLHKELVHYFLSTSSRWKKLHFSLADGPESNSLWYEIRELFLVSVPLLEAFEFNARTPSARTVRFREKRAPKLRSFQDFRADVNPLFHSLPWSQLTHLKYVHRAGIPRTLDLLEKSPNLEVLDMCIEQYRLITTVVGLPAPVRLNHLWSLTVRSDRGNVDALLDSLLLPSLSELTVINLSQLQQKAVPWTVQGIQSLVDRSGPNCNVKALRLKGYDCGSDVKAELLSRIKSLEILNICP